MTARPRALVTPAIDFLCTGGGCIVFAAVYLALEWIYAPVFRWEMTAQLSVWGYYLGFVVNNPHFIFSYLLFYSGFSRRLRDGSAGWPVRARYAVAGIAVPLALVLAALWSWSRGDMRVLQYGIILMFVTVGWHYTKQGYGVLITQSLYKGIFFSVNEKRILRANAYAAWFYAWIHAVEKCGSTHHFWGLYYSCFRGYPGWLPSAALYVLAVTSVLSVLVILYRALWLKKGVSWNGVCGYVAAAYVWQVFMYANPVLFMLWPFFHSLQYLPYVYRFKKSEWREKGAKAEKFARKYAAVTIFATAGFLFAALFMEVLPHEVDKVYGGLQGLHRHFFIIAALLFINIHHYFMDNAFWRKENRDVQEYLFKA